ncbi:MAG: hypothetical protein ACYC49_00255 [Ignavibacteriaceae bacterium]
MKKDIFLKNLKITAPEIYHKIIRGEFSDAILLLDITSQKEKHLYLVQLIARGLDLLENGEKDAASNLFLLLSELAGRSSLKSFCLDAMLVAEDDFEGEFKSIEELRKYFEEHIKARR